MHAAAASSARPLARPLPARRRSSATRQPPPKIKTHVRVVEEEVVRNARRAVRANERAARHDGAEDDVADA